MSRENSRPKILLTGKTGQVGRELAGLLDRVGEVTAVDRQQLDLTKPDEIRRVVRGVRPSLIVNAAAYTAVDRAESDEAVAQAINGVAPGVLAEEAKRLGALLVHYSTDYIFDGTKRQPYEEDDSTNPLSAYGQDCAGPNRRANVEPGNCRRHGEGAGTDTHTDSERPAVAGNQGHLPHDRRRRNQLVRVCEIDSGTGREPIAARSVACRRDARPAADDAANRFHRNEGVPHAGAPASLLGAFEPASEPRVWGKTAGLGGATAHHFQRYRRWSPVA